MRAWWRTCKTNRRKLVTTGHSLGGALAAIFSACSMVLDHGIEEVEALYSIGMPAPTSPPLSKRGQVFPGVRFVQTAQFLGSTYYDVVPVISRAIRTAQSALSITEMHFPEQDAIMVGWKGLLPPPDFDAKNYR